MTATITSLGVGSGLDLNTIVTKLVALERQPLTQLQTTASDLQTEVSSFGQISSLMSTLQTASNALTDPTLWRGSTVTSGDSSTVSVSSASGVTAGNYAVTVQQLAASQTLATGTTFTDASASVGSGTLTLQLGSWSAGQTAFTTKTGSTAVNISVTSSDTLTTLRDKINGAGLGVTASLVTDSSGVRLSLQSTATGAANGFRVTAADDDGSNTDSVGLSIFAFDPPSGATAMNLMQGSTDAKATVNGISVVSASNSVSGVVDGLTMNLNKVSSTPVNLAATSDSTSVETAIKTFATAYNALASYISDQTKYDATTKVGGALQGDSSVNNLQAKLRSMLGATSGASSTYTRLADVGLEMQRDGTVTVNETKLSAATANLSELKKAFMNSDTSNAGNDGFATRYATLATQALGLDGVVTTRTASLNKMLTSNSADQDALNTRVDAFQTRLVAQYTALDTKVAQLNALSSYVTQQVTLWTNKSSS